MLDLINYEKNQKIIKDIELLKTILERNESLYKLGVMEEEEYKLNNIFVKERLDEIEKELMKWDW